MPLRKEERQSTIPSDDSPIYLQIENQINSLRRTLEGLETRLSNAQTENSEGTQEMNQKIKLSGTPIDEGDSVDDGISKLAKGMERGGPLTPDEEVALKDRLGQTSAGMTGTPKVDLSAEELLDSMGAEDSILSGEARENSRHYTEQRISDAINDNVLVLAAKQVVQSNESLRDENDSLRLENARLRRLLGGFIESAAAGPIRPRQVDPLSTGLKDGSD